MKARSQKLERQQPCLPAVSRLQTEGLPASSTKTLAVLTGLALVAMTAAAYLPAVGGGFIWDDDDYITKNMALRSLRGLAHIWTEPGATAQYYPLTFTTFWIEYQLWELNPAGYQVTNILLQGLNAVLLWILLRRLALPGAWLAAAVFAVHPVHVESVAWITERKNVLCGAFYLATALAYMRYAGIDGAPAGPSRPGRCYALALVLFACALLSKSAACTLPAALLLVLWWKRDRIGRRDVRPLLPFFGMSLVMGLVTVWVEKTHVGAVGQDWSLSWLERGLVAGRAVWFYVAKLVWPQPLIFIYPRWAPDAAAWWQYVYPLGVIGAVVALWLTRHRIGKGPLTAALYFVGTLLPALGFVNIYYMRYSFVADHFQYLASMGIIVLAVAGGVKAAGKLVPGGRLAAAVLAAILLVLLSALTWRQGHVYADLPTLWQDVLRKNPSAWIAHNNLGSMYAERGDSSRAIEHFDKCLRLNPGHAEVFANRGMAYASRGAYDLAIRDYTRAIELNTDYADAYHKRGVAYFNIQQFFLAILDYTKVIELRPNFAEAYNNRGTAYCLGEAYDQAIQDYDRAIELKPSFAEAYNNRGAAYFEKGDYGRAVQDYSSAIKLRPDYAKAYSNRGKSRYRLDDPTGAIDDHNMAVQIDPKLAVAWYNRGSIYCETSDYPRAVQDLTRAIELNPDDAEAYGSRARAYCSLNDYAQAWADVEKCRQLGGHVDPGFVKALEEASRRTEPARE